MPTTPQPRRQPRLRSSGPLSGAVGPEARAATPLSGTGGIDVFVRSGACASPPPAWAGARRARVGAVGCARRSRTRGEHARGALAPVAAQPRGRWRGPLQNAPQARENAPQGGALRRPQLGGVSAAQDRPQHARAARLAPRRAARRPCRFRPRTPRNIAAGHGQNRGRARAAYRKPTRNLPGPAARQAPRRRPTAADRSEAA